MGSLFSKETSFKAAGCIFTDKIHILAGYQPNKKVSFISGFGGKRKGNETFVETALRETLEEILGIEELPQYLIETIQKTMTPENVISDKNYITLVYPFQHLTAMLIATQCFIDALNIYPAGFPRTINSLIMERVVDPSSEVTHLCLLPVSKNLTIDPLFIEDINKLSLT